MTSNPCSACERNGQEPEPRVRYAEAFARADQPALDRLADRLGVPRGSQADPCFQNWLGLAQDCEYQRVFLKLDKVLKQASAFEQFSKRMALGWNQPDALSGLNEVCKEVEEKPRWKMNSQEVSAQDGETWRGVSKQLVLDRLQIERAYHGRQFRDRALEVFRPDRGPYLEMSDLTFEDYCRAQIGRGGLHRHGLAAAKAYQGVIFFAARMGRSVSAPVAEQCRKYFPWLEKEGVLDGLVVDGRGPKLLIERDVPASELSVTSAVERLKYYYGDEKGQCLYSRFVALRNLKPEINAAQFIRVYREAVPCRHVRVEEVEFTPTHYHKATKQAVMVQLLANGVRKIIFYDGHGRGHSGTEPSDQYAPPGAHFADRFEPIDQAQALPAEPALPIVPARVREEMTR